MLHYIYGILILMKEGYFDLPTSPFHLGLSSLSKEDVLTNSLSIAQRQERKDSDILETRIAQL